MFNAKIMTFHNILKVQLISIYEACKYMIFEHEEMGQTNIMTI